MHACVQSESLIFTKKLCFQNCFKRLLLFENFRHVYNAFSPNSICFFLPYSSHTCASSPSQLHVLTEALGRLCALESYFKELTNNYRDLTCSLQGKKQTETQERDLKCNSLVPWEIIVPSPKAFL